jgi:hypothetical protein
VSTATITVRTRMILQDQGRPFACNVICDGVSTVFDLPVESISQVASPPIVVLGGQIISNQATPQYTLDYKHGVIAFSGPPQPQGTDLGVQGMTYDFFDDDEVAQAVTDAFYQHTTDLDPLPVIDPIPGLPQIPPAEEYLVAIMAAVELLWFRATDASQTIDIHTPEGVTIPRSERFRQITAQINNLQEEYKTICGALGVGLWRIQILNQRRVSYTTNRFVPIFREQEYNQPYAAFFPTAAPVGSIVTITGMFFSNTTAVTFGGVPATNFNIVSDTELQATVPTGAQTGQIGVTTPYGVVLSTAQFVVGQPPPFVLYGPEMVKPPIPPGI